MPIELLCRTTFAMDAALLSKTRRPARPHRRSSLFELALLAPSNSPRVGRWPRTVHLSVPHFTKAYEFSSIRRVADVGGGTGRFIANILAPHPGTRAILFDLSHVVASTPTLSAASGVEPRCEVVGGGFFDGVPPSADAYMMRPILRDREWRALDRILKNIRKAMTEDAIVLIMEHVLPDKVEAGRAIDSCLLYLEMPVHTLGGRERSKSEFNQILKVAAGFGPLRHVQTTTATSIVEARPA